MKWLQGKRTYLLTFLGFVTAGFYGLGYIDKETFEAIASLFGFGSIAALRAATK